MAKRKGGRKIPASVSVQEVTDFCKTRRERKEIEREFGLSNTQSYNLLKWMRKAGLVTEVCDTVNGRGGRVLAYTAIRK